MKKILFCAGVLALAASCTEDFDTASLQQTQQESGIVFTTGDDAVTTRGEYLDENGVYYPFWTAEKDYISVFSFRTGTDIDADGELDKFNNSWGTAAGLNATEVTYKATKSERFASFTGVQPNNVLDFTADATEDSPAKFIAFYPQLTSGVSNYTYAPNAADGVDEEVTITLPKIETTQTQENTTGQNIYSKIAKYAVANAWPKSYNVAAVGENISLNFTRLTPAVVYQTKGLDAYAEDFGNLMTVKLESDGILNNQGKPNATNKSTLTQDGLNVVLTLEGAENGAITSQEYEITGTNSASDKAITLTLGSIGTGLEWSDAARAYMAITNVERVNAQNQAYTEQMSVTYTFANIAIKETVNTSASWVAPDFYEYKALDVNAYPYLVFNNTKDYSGTRVASEYTVLLNSGKLSQIYDKNGAVKLLDGTTVAAANIKKVIAKPALTADDFEALGKLENVEQLILEAQTSVPANAFEGLTKIEKLEMPKVTTIDEDFLGEDGSLGALKYLNLASYKFDGNGGTATVAAAVNQALFANKTNMDYVDMTALEDMTPIFGYPEAQLSFMNCTALDSVKVNNLKLRSNSFSGCTSLQKVNGSVDVSEGYAAFQGCNNGSTLDNVTDVLNLNDATYKANKAKYFTTITLTSSVIAEDAFNGCTYLSEIKMGNAQVAPTSIGKRAFQNVKALQYMDLSKAATIESEAFNGAKNYVGTNKTNDIITSIVPVIRSSAFANTGIAKIEFTEATRFENNFLAGSENVVHLKFMKPFAVSGTTALSANIFGPNDPSQITLFYAEGQQGLSGRTLTLRWTVGETSGSRAYNFWDVQKN